MFTDVAGRNNFQGVIRYIKATCHILHIVLRKEDDVRFTELYIDSVQNYNGLHDKRGDEQHQLHAERIVQHFRYVTELQVHEPSEKRLCLSS